MIRTEELRIGNYVKSVRTGEAIAVDWIAIKHVYDGNTLQPPHGMGSVYEPILLTEELLLKCGFRKENNVIPIYTLGLVSIYWISAEYPNGRLYFNSWCIHKENPKSLHQLQNLYFALTGEELDIKL